MKVLIVHNSDRVRACFYGSTTDVLISKILYSKYHDDILNRLIEGCADDDPIDENSITIDMITSLYHDGDSLNGYTILEAL